jgi:hypothetical protein
MDYRHTEDFARRMETAELRAHALRRQASEEFWNGVAALLRRAFAALQRRLANGRRGPARATA